MKKWICALLCFGLLSSLSAGFAIDPGLLDGGFSDVEETAWYALCVQDVKKRGLMEGVGGNAFHPEGALTRAMLVTTLWRMNGKPEPAAANPFPDVPGGAWYTDAVLWAAEKAVVQGTGDGRFAPDQAVTRQELAVIFYRWAERQGYDTDLSPFAEAHTGVSDWAADGIDWAVDRCLLVNRYDRSGESGSWSIHPADAATRGEIAVFLSRLCMEYLDKAEGRTPATCSVRCYGELQLAVDSPDSTLTRMRHLTIRPFVHMHGASLQVEKWVGGTETVFAQPFPENMVYSEGGRTAVSGTQEYYFDAEGRLTDYGSSYEGQKRLNCHIVYTAWGDPLCVNVWGTVTSLYYTVAEGRSVLTAYESIGGNSAAVTYLTEPGLNYFTDYYENDPVVRPMEFTASIAENYPQWYQSGKYADMTIRADFPQIVNAEGNEIREMMNEMFVTHGGDLIGLKLPDYWTKDLDPAGTYRIDDTFQITRSGRLLSLRWNRAVDMDGQRHTEVFGSTFDLTNGYDLTLEQVFGVSWEALKPRLTQLLEWYAAKSEAKPDGLTEEEIASLKRSDFYLTENSVVLLFPPAESGGDTREISFGIEAINEYNRYPDNILW